MFVVIVAGWEDSGQQLRQMQNLFGGSNSDRGGNSSADLTLCLQRSSKQYMLVGSALRAGEL